MKGLKTVYKMYSSIKPAKQGWGRGGYLLLSITNQDPVAVILIII